MYKRVRVRFAKVSVNLLRIIKSTTIGRAGHNFQCALLKWPVVPEKQKISIQFWFGPHFEDQFPAGNQFGMVNEGLIQGFPVEGHGLYIDVFIA